MIASEAVNVIDGRIFFRYVSGIIRWKNDTRAHRDGTTPELAQHGTHELDQLHSIRVYEFGTHGRKLRDGQLYRRRIGGGNAAPGGDGAIEVASILGTSRVAVIRIEQGHKFVVARSGLRKRLRICDVVGIENNGGARSKPLDFFRGDPRFARNESSREYFVRLGCVGEKYQQAPRRSMRRYRWIERYFETQRRPEGEHT